MGSLSWTFRKNKVIKIVPMDSFWTSTLICACIRTSVSTRESYHDHVFEGHALGFGWQSISHKALAPMQWTAIPHHLHTCTHASNRPILYTNILYWTSSGNGLYTYTHRSQRKHCLAEQITLLNVIGERSVPVNMKIKVSKEKVVSNWDTLPGMWSQNCFLSSFTVTGPNSPMYKQNSVLALILGNSWAIHSKVNHFLRQSSPNSSISMTIQFQLINILIQSSPNSPTI